MGATVKPVEFSTIKAKLRAHICINKKKAKYLNLEQSLTKVKKSFQCTLARLKQCSELMSVSTKKAKSLIFEFRTKFLYSPAYIEQKPSSIAIHLFIRKYEISLVVDFLNENIFV